MNSPGQETGAVVFPREQYDALESAVMESARGRWFLAEYARRNRAADTVMLLDALRKLENVASSNGVKPDKALPDIDRLAETIKAARSDIAATHNDLLPDGGILPADGALYGRIAADARNTSSEIARRSISLRVIAGGLRAATADEEHVKAVETNARSLETLSWSQEVLSERIAKAMGLLSHIDETLTGFVSEPSEPELGERQTPYFSRDEDLFEPAREAPPKRAEPAAETKPPEALPVEPPPAEAKPRIVVIRRGKDEPIDIPLSS